jgi:uncharacterized OB-fold protein
MEIPRHWRLRKQRYSLTGEICPHCEAKLFPPRVVCPECGGETRREYNLRSEELAGSIQKNSSVFAEIPVARR